MKIVKLIIISVLGLFYSCTNAPNENREPEKGKNEVKRIVFSKSQLAKATMSCVMGKPIDIIDAVSEGSYARVSYIRPDDGKEFIYKVKTNGNKLIWGNIDGRWRDHELDSKITFSQSDSVIIIREDYGDGSIKTEKYHFSELK